MGKETIVHTDHQSLQYFQWKTKLQQSRNFRLMGFLQQFHLSIRYKKGIFNKFSDMLSRPIISASTLLKNDFILHESYIEQYKHDIDFQDVYASLSEGNQVKEKYYQMHKTLFFHLGKLCIP